MVHSLLLKSLKALIDSKKISALEVAFALKEIRKLEALLDKRDQTLIERLTRRKKTEYQEALKGITLYEDCTNK